jgi:hypothetical protein
VTGFSNIPILNILDRESHAVMFEHGRERLLQDLQTKTLVRKIHEIILSHLVRTEEHLANASKEIKQLTVLYRTF